MLGSSGGARPSTIAAAALLLTGAATLGGCTPPTSGDFTVLSYNVAGLPAEVSTEDPTAHIPLISPLLDAYDVVLTQEDFDWWVPALDGFDFAHYHEWLRAQTTQPYRSARWPGPAAAGVDPAVRPDPFVGDGLGVLSRPAFTDERRVAWHDCFGGVDTSDGGAADCLAGKGFAVVTMTLAPGRLVDVYTLHGEAGATDEDQRLQQDDFVQLAAYIEQHSAGRAVIVGGDTNLHTNSTHPDAHGLADTLVWQAFRDRLGLTDACLALGCPDVASIDKIAYRDGGGVDLTATSHAMPRERFRDAEGDDLSDHPPLV
ncbi:MAG TPA: endonuclease/exonuclease/phosphatase family protein, partial [Acidimicrobiales bacterium]